MSKKKPTSEGYEKWLKEQQKKLEEIAKKQKSKERR